MSDYDDTNKGVFFKPYDDQKLIGSGRLNIEGRETRVVAVMERLGRDTPPTMVLYQRLAPLFPNESENENAPDRSGPIDFPPDYRIAAWKGEKDGKPYFSLRVSKKQTDGNGSSGSSAPSGGRQEPVSDGWDDEIPF